MVDQVYQPIVSDDDDQSETPSPTTDLPIRSFKSRSEEGVDRSDLTTEEAANQRRRRPDPESPESAYERPLTVHKVKDGDGPLSLNEAADNLAYSRGWQHGDELRAAGMTQRQLDEIAADVLERGQRRDPQAPPPPEVKVLEHFGEDKQVLTPAQAADELTNWRARHAEAQQEALQELVGEAQQEVQAEAAQQQPEPPQPQPQPEQTERAQLAQERQRIANLKQMEGVEAAARIDYDQLVAAVVEQFPSLRNGPPDPAHVEQLRVQDPERFQKLAMADQMLRERQQRIAALAQQRGQRDQQQARATAQQRAAARAAQDQAFEGLAAQHIPGWERVQGEVKQQAVKTLESAGLTQAQIHQLWSGDDAIDAHSSVLQLLLAKAALYDRAQAKAQQIRQAPIPPVIRPGTYRAASDGGESVRDLQSQLSRSSGREALRIGAALTKAKRAMNGG